jgi:hypothetical protein
MRGLASVLTIAFVFASASLLLGQAAGQGSTDPASPEEYRQPPTDATIEGVVSGPDGPLEGVQVSSSSYGSPPTPEPMPAEEADDSDPDSGSGSSNASIRCYDCYYGGYNSTVTDSEGRFSLGVYSGENQLSVYHPKFRSAYVTLTVAPGDEATQDIVLEAYPEKTAHLVGTITDANTGKGLGFAYVNVRSPVYGLYACSQNEEQPQPYAEGDDAVASEPASDDMAKSSIAYPYEPEPCDIRVHSDGSFEGSVTPGYSILSVYAYQDCSTTRDADGGGSTTCGPEYLAFSRTLNLPANETTRVDVALRSRPSPDATVSGYLVDIETGKAIPDGQISFSNQETYAWGSATTDSDGSFKIRLRSGYHSVSVYAPGHYSWEGVLAVPEGSSDFDVLLTPGEESYGGGCCYAYAMDSKGAVAESAAPTAAGGASQALNAADGDEGAESGQSAYEDLGGGLGPYNADERSGATANSDGELEDSDKGAPGAGLLLALTALGAVLVLRRRQA